MQMPNFYQRVDQLYCVRARYTPVTSSDLSVSVIGGSQLTQLTPATPKAASVPTPGLKVSPAALQCVAGASNPRPCMAAASVVSHRATRASLDMHEKLLTLCHGVMGTHLKVRRTNLVVLA